MRRIANADVNKPPDGKSVLRVDLPKSNKQANAIIASGAIKWGTEPYSPLRPPNEVELVGHSKEALQNQATRCDTRIF